VDGLVVIEGGAMHHFKNCGLDYVWLRNGFEYRDTPNGRAVRIHDLNGLHEAIAKWVVTNPMRFRGQEVRYLRSMLGLSQDGLSKALGRKRASVARWEADRMKAIPQSADHSLRMFYVLKATGHEVACKLVELLSELDELQHGVQEQKEARFADDVGWKAAA
jgi:DNA-binding transcriptional regulator YiaG